MADVDTQYSVSSNEHFKNLTDAVRGMRTQAKFADATLACEGEFYPVHKFLLAACSKYFAAMFDNTPCVNPVIVVHNMARCDLESILDFVYLGEACVKGDDYSQFQEAAKGLWIRGFVTDDKKIDPEKVEQTDSSAAQIELPAPRVKYPTRNNLVGNMAGKPTTEMAPPHVAPPKRKRNTAVVGIVGTATGGGSRNRKRKTTIAAVIEALAANNSGYGPHSQPVRTVSFADELKSSVAASNTSVPFNVQSANHEEGSQSSNVSNFFKPMLVLTNPTGSKMEDGEMNLQSTVSSSGSSVAAPSSALRASSSSTQFAPVTNDAISSVTSSSRNVINLSSLDVPSRFLKTEVTLSGPSASLIKLIDGNLPIPANVQAFQLSDSIVYDQQIVERHKPLDLAVAGPSSAANLTTLQQQLSVGRRNVFFGQKKPSQVNAPIGVVAKQLNMMAHGDLPVTDPGPFQCTHCKKQYKKEYTFRMHFATHFDRQCPDCSFTTSGTIEDLWTHRESAHNFKIWRCNLCSYLTEKHQNFTKHSKNHSNVHPYKSRQLQVQANTMQFSCPECSYKCQKAIDMRAHVAVIHGGVEAIQKETHSPDAAVIIDGNVLGSFPNLSNHLVAAGDAQTQGLALHNIRSTARSTVPSGAQNDQSGSVAAHNMQAQMTQQNVLMCTEVLPEAESSLQCIKATTEVSQTVATQQDQEAAAAAELLRLGYFQQSQQEGLPNMETNQM